MNKLEAYTTMLENHIYRRNLSYIVDKDYKLEKSKVKSETVVFLNKLTEFFYNFHENTVFYKKELEKFMEERKDVLYRFNQSSINFYDLTVVPNNEISHYDFIPRPIKNIEKYNKKLSKNLRQIPFSRILKFKKKDIIELADKAYFLCFARIAISAESTVKFKMGFVSDQDTITMDDLMPFTLKQKSNIFNINKILKIKNSQRTRILLKGFSDKKMQINKIEAQCINFNDVKDQNELKKHKKDKKTV